MKTKARFKGRTRHFICVSVITLPLLMKRLSPMQDVKNHKTYSFRCDLCLVLSEIRKN